MEESRQEISVQFVSGIGEDSFPPLKHQSIDSETTLSIDHQPQEVSRVSGGTGKPLASESGDKTLFHGYDSDEIQEAVMKRPRIYESEEDEFIPEYKLVPKPRSQGQSVSPPNILAGSKSRLKDLVLDKFPSREMGISKLPKGEKVMLCFFYHLLQDPDRISNSNKWTLASDKAARAAGYKTVEDIKVIYRLHFGIKLIDIKVSKMIEDDKNFWQKSSFNPNTSP